MGSVTNKSVTTCYFYLQRVFKATEILDLSTKQQVTELSEGQEDDEEHDKESGQILGTAAQSGRQLGHGLVEADVFEDLKHKFSSLINSRLCVEIKINHVKIYRCSFNIFWKPRIC